jgi:hypothetical protein
MARSVAGFNGRERKAALIEFIGACMSRVPKQARGLERSATCEEMAGQHAEETRTDENE